MTTLKVFATLAVILAAATAGAAGAIALSPDVPLPFEPTAAPAPAPALIPGHLGSVLTPEEQWLLVEAWRDHDDAGASFILMGGMRTPLPVAIN